MITYLILFCLNHPDIDPPPSSPDNQTAPHPKMPPIPPTTKVAIEARLRAGEPSRQIAHALGVSKSSVNRLRLSMPADTPRGKAGAPTKLTHRDKTYAVNLIKRGVAKTAVEATKLLNEGR